MSPVLSGLVSPCPQSCVALQHALQQVATTTTTSCSVAERAARVVYHCQHVIKRTHRLAVYGDGPWTRPGRDWTLVEADATLLLPSPWHVVHERADPRPTTHQLAVAVLDSTTNTSSCSTIDETTTRTSDCVAALHERLWWSLGTELRGRTAADAALCIALAGVVDRNLDAVFAHTLELEIRRRPAAKVLVHAVEKLYAAGGHLSVATRDLLSVHTGLPVNVTSLWDDRPLLWLWRTAAKLPRAPPPLREEDLCDDATSMAVAAQLDKLVDSQRPIILDLGCGFGVSLLHMAVQDAKEEDGDVSGVAKDHRPFFVGCDTHQTAIQYAQGMAVRFNVTDRLAFLPVSTMGLLHACIARGQVVADILLQFPTPYRLLLPPSSAISEEAAAHGGGNTHLPDQDSFMGSQRTIQQIARLLLLQERNHPRLLLQSNCEDVAVQLTKWAEEAGLVMLPVEDDKDTVRSPPPAMTERTTRWLLQTSEHRRRAVGYGWSATPLLPSRSETEVSCQWERVPIHRCRLAAVAVPIATAVERIDSDDEL